MHLTVRRSTAGSDQADQVETAREGHGAGRADLCREHLVSRCAAGRTTGLPAELLERLRRLEDVLGIGVVDAIIVGMAAEQGSLAEVLGEGARVCFTGTAVDPAGRIWARGEMSAAAAARGLVPVGSVTKTRCDVLVVAEVGTQSGKARKAKELGKPVFSADEFFAWLTDGA